MSSVTWTIPAGKRVDEVIDPQVSDDELRQRDGGSGRRAAHRALLRNQAEIGERLKRVEWDKATEADQQVLVSVSLQRSEDARTTALERLRNEAEMTHTLRRDRQAKIDTRKQSAQQVAHRVRRGESES